MPLWNLLAPLACGVALLLFRPAPLPAASVAPNDAATAAGVANATIPDGLRRLVAAYPEHLAHALPNALVWKDGTRMVYDEGRTHPTFADMLNHPDLKDQMAQAYPAGPDYAFPPPEDHDPGRVRCLPFFRKMYGATSREVQAKLGQIVWMPRFSGKVLPVTTVNGADKRLAAVSQALEALPESLRRYVSDPSGTYNDRSIAGTARLSPHALGIAADIDARAARYWRWDLLTPHPRSLSKFDIPYAIVAIFEANGFIWGGKWRRYDTMHFEYRPELLPEKP